MTSSGRFVVFDIFYIHLPSSPPPPLAMNTSGFLLCQAHGCLPSEEQHGRSVQNCIIGHWDNVNRRIELLDWRLSQHAVIRYCSSVCSHQQSHSAFGLFPTVCPPFESHGQCIMCIELIDMNSEPFLSDCFLIFACASSQHSFALQECRERC